MEKVNYNYRPLIVIVGQTASGKSAAAIEVAKKFNGEIICADSRTIYKGMDIGTAKPTKQEQNEVKHHLLDVIEPGQSFSVSDFKDLAEEAIEEIQNRGKLPILVGGSGLYINSVIYGYEFRPVNDELKSQFENSSVEDLQAELLNRGIALPENSKNKRYLLRSLEAGSEPGQHLRLRDNTLVIGLDINPEVLLQRIKDRIDVMVDNGLVDEVKKLGEKYGWVIPPMQAPAYKSFKNYLDGSISLENAKQEFARLDWQLARKQRTWFKRNNSIHWLDDPSKVFVLTQKFLNNHT